MLDLFTVVWGSEYASYYRDSCLPSLMQPGNISAAKEMISSYTFYADDDAARIITQSELYREMARLIPLSHQPIVKAAWHVNPSIIKQMETSAQKGNHMLIVSPDWIFSNGSIFNMARLCAEGGYSLILFGYPKILPPDFEQISQTLRTGGTVSNRRLVSAAIRSGAIKVWPSSRDGPVCGALAQQDNHSWLGFHRQPTPCIKPDGAIISFFSGNYTPNQGYDHALPYWMIQGGYSWHYILDTDVFFLVEIALAWRGGSGPWRLDLLSLTDQYFSQYQMILRGEDA